MFIPSIRRDRPEVVTRHRDSRNRLADHSLNRAHHRDLVGSHESIRVAFLRGAPGAANTVHVVLGLLRHVIVDHVRDARDIKAALSDIRGDEHRRLAVLEVLQRSGTLCLGLVGMHRRRAHAGLLQVADDAVGAVLGA